MMVLVLKNFEDFMDAVDRFGVRALILFRKNEAGDEIEYYIVSGKVGCRVSVKKGSDTQERIEKWLKKVDAKEVVEAVPLELFF